MDSESSIRKGRRAAGDRGEQQACSYLEQLGYSILARNWRSGHLELDIVAADPAGNLRFVEVKTRIEPFSVAPELQVDHVKRRRLEAAAMAYLQDPQAPKPLSGSGESFFDIVAVVLGGEHLEVNYFPSAWIPMYV